MTFNTQPLESGDNKADLEFLWPAFLALDSSLDSCQVGVCPGYRDTSVQGDVRSQV